MINVVFDTLLPWIGHSLATYIGIKITVVTALHLVDEATVWMTKQARARR